MMPLPDWDSPVYTIDNDEDYRALERPQPRIIYDDYTMPPTLVTKQTYPELVERYEAGQVRGE
jgi:hypothetical protein